MWFVLLAIAQDEGLIRQLGDDDPRVRVEARRILLESKDARSLREALADSDPEVRENARGLLMKIDPTFADQQLEAAQRARKLHLVTIDAKAWPLGSIVDDLAGQVGLRIENSQSRLCSLRAKDMPLIQALDLLEVPTAPQPNSLYVPGARFVFTRTEWAPHGERKGFIFRTAVTQDMSGDLEWEVARIRTDCEVGFETCAVHSPAAVYVPRAELPEARVTIKGKRRWYCDTPVVFERPKDGECRKIGKFTLEIKWPQMVVRCDEDVYDMVMHKTLNSSDVVWNPRSDRIQRCTMGHGRAWG